MRGKNQYVGSAARSGFEEVCTLFKESRDQDRSSLPIGVKRNFIPSDFRNAHRSIELGVEEGVLHQSSTVLDLGSGNGVITCAFGMLGFTSYGIELSDVLVDEARKNKLKVAELGLLGGSAMFAGGNYLPVKVRKKTTQDIDGYVLLNGENDPYVNLGVTSETIDIFYCWPWPDQLPSLYVFFGECAKPGALFLLNSIEASFTPRTMEFAYPSVQLHRENELSGSKFQDCFTIWEKRC